jgi:zinc transport system substrate-binding protein
MDTMALKTRQPGWRSTLRLLFFLWTVLWAVSIPAQAAAYGEKILIAATIQPLGDFAEKIGGDRVQVQVLIPPGASPHVFEPSPFAVAQASKARVFVYVGAGLEPWAEKFLRARGRAGMAVVEATKGIPLIREVEGKHHGEEPEEKEHEGHSHEAGNPHVWLDPVLAQGICRQIASALIQVDPTHRSQYEANLQSYLGALEELNREIQQQVSTFRLREFVSFHAAFAYFARRYNLRVVGVIELAPGREPTPRHLQRIVAAIKHYGIRVVFAEPQLNPRVAQVVAQEAGVKVLMLDPEGSRPPYGGDYLKMMRHNLAVLAEAMK